VSDFEPGSLTVADTGRAGVGAGQGSGGLAFIECDPIDCAERGGQRRAWTWCTIADTARPAPGRVSVIDLVLLLLLGSSTPTAVTVTVIVTLCPGASALMSASKTPFQVAPLVPLQLIDPPEPEQSPGTDCSFTRLSVKRIENWSGVGPDAVGRLLTRARNRPIPLAIIDPSRSSAVSYDLVFVSDGEGLGVGLAAWVGCPWGGALGVALGGADGWADGGPDGWPEGGEAGEGWVPAWALFSAPDGEAEGWSPFADPP